MSAHALKGTCGENKSGLTPSLGVVGIYESARDLARMHYVFRELAGEPGGEFSVYCDWFDFRELKNQHLARRARHEAADADLILLSADSHAEPPCRATEWLERCVAKEQMRQATVEIPLTPDNSSQQVASPLRAYLREATRLPRADILSRFAAADSTAFASRWMVARPESKGVLFEFAEQTDHAGADSAK